MRVSWRRFESFFSLLASLSMSMIPGGSHGSIQQLSSKMAVVLSSLKETDSPLQNIGLPLTKDIRWSSEEGISDRSWWVEGCRDIQFRSELTLAI